MFCIYCGTDNPNNAIFCRGCGKHQPTNDGTIVAAPGIFMNSGQSTTGNAPMIQGTPQASGVPTVQGTPSIPGNEGGGQSMLHNTASSASSATRPTQAPSYMPREQPPHPDHSTNYRTH